MAKKNVKVMKLDQDAIIPEFKTPGAAGFDISSIEEVTLKPISLTKVPLEGEDLKEAEDKVIALAKTAMLAEEIKTVTSLIGEDGLRAAILANLPKESFVKQVPTSHPVAVRTGLAFEVPMGYELEMRGRSGLGFTHDVHVFNGTIDADYRGEVGAKLYNLGNEPITLPKGSRIAQGIIKKVENVSFSEVDELSTTERGDKGFGSTGK